MYKSPRPESSTDFNPKNSFIDPAEGRRFEKFIKREDKIERKKKLTRGQKLRKALAVTAGIMAPLVVANGADIFQNYEAATHAEIGLNYMGPALNPANNDTALFFFNGFNSYDADPIVNSLGTDVQHAIDGQKISISYANAPLNETSFDTLADDMRDYTTKHHIKNAVIVSYSLGCVPGTITGQKLTEGQQNNPLVKAFVYISCPSDYDALRSSTQNEVDFVKAVSPNPLVAYSSPVRLAGEMYFLNQEYEDGNPLSALDHFGALYTSAVNDMNRKNATSTSSIFDQALLIEQAHFDQRFKTIADNTQTSLKPAIFYFGTGKGGYDTVVNDKQSARDITKDAAHAGLPELTYEVPNAVHAEPWKNPKDYARTFAIAKTAIGEVLGEQQDLYDLRLHSVLGQKISITK